MQAILFAATADAGTSREIYESVLGFPCEEDTLFELVFDVSATQLRVRKVETVLNPSYTTLGFAVTDIANTIAEIRTEGVQFEFYELNEAGSFRDQDRTRWYRNCPVQGPKR